ncbi:arylsulfatase I-like [Aplysia californica]|uniref:Arylsulfatase I-like n=1 Tax=Aplysia californica TaxID=6500 RepID=A0ABM1ADJ7_APLCA|nr:arylsulfatase I-like [Aplysia californica]
MIHAVDWFPTIAEAVGLNYTNSDQDGVSQWSSITSLGPSSRDQFVYNLDLHPFPAQGRSAIRVGDYKLVMGYPGLYQDWYKPEDDDQGPVVTAQVVVQGNANQMQGLNVTGDYNFLFNLKDDPEERNNLYDKLPDVVKKLEAKLADETRRYTKPDYPDNNPKSNPLNFGGAWSPGWC